MIYRVTHLTSYAYGEPVDLAHHLLHLTPRHLPNQIVLMNKIITAPPAARNVTHQDHFGNEVTMLMMGETHEDFSVQARAEVDVSAPNVPRPSATPKIANVASILQKADTPDAIETSEFTYASPFVGLDADIREYAAQSLSTDVPILAGALDLTRRIYQDFAYTPGTTAISTPVADVLKARNGVCQDFAHVAIAGLRAHGLAARYVSGYIRTYSSDSSAFRGADASHAWFDVWCGEYGWIGLDPTNDLIVRDEHIVLAIGRDFGDVSPVSGVILGGGRQHLTVAVTVTPLDEAGQA